MDHATGLSRSHRPSFGKGSVMSLRVRPREVARQVNEAQGGSERLSPRTQKFVPTVNSTDSVCRQHESLQYADRSDSDCRRSLLPVYDQDKLSQQSLLCGRFRSCGSAMGWRSRNDRSQLEESCRTSFAPTYQRLLAFVVRYRNRLPPFGSPRSLPL